MQSSFPPCLQYCSIGICEVTGGDVCSAALHLLVKLPEVSESYVTVKSVTEVFPLPVFCFTGHSLGHFCLFLHLRLKSDLGVACFFPFATTSQLLACQSTMLGFLVPPGWLDDDFLSQICCASCLLSSQH